MKRIKWEYLEIKVDIDNNLTHYFDQIKKLGEDGWELVTAISYNPAPSRIQYIFKRMNNGE
jgi:hypothetical protein